MPADLFAAIAALDPGRDLLVALDFDGTLSHLVPVPSDARPAPGVLRSLADLSQAPRTDVVLISGRALHDLAEVSGAAGIAQLIGSHGQEHGSTTALTPAESAHLADLRAAIEAAVDGVDGVRLEHKPAGLAVHVRHCPPPDAAAVIAQARAIAHARPGTHLMDGKMVVELSVRPLDKGSALRALLEARPGRRVVFAGDDVTDEAAMAALGPDDLSIKVGPGETIARFRVADPNEMVQVLEALAQVRRAPEV